MIRYDTRGLTVRIVDAATSDGSRVELATYPAEPREEPDIALVHVHGKGGNFYGLPFRPLAPRLKIPGAVHVSVNLRSRDLAYTRTDVVSADSVREADVAVGGGMWEDLELGVHDIDAAVEHARLLGAEQVVIVGHSAGGFYAADYVAQRPGILGVSMLSPLTSNTTNLGMWFPEGNLEESLDRARALVAAGRGHHLIPIPAWYYAVSARTLLQRAAEPDGVWSQNLEQAGVPVQVLWGGTESRGALFQRLVDELRVEVKQTVVLPGCDHNYIGFEDAAAQHVGDFVSRLREATRTDPQAQ